MSSQLLVVTVIALVAVGALAVRRSLTVSQPDEWLLLIRNGRLIRAGVGIVVWRRPGDVVARFTSTVQRVGFSVEALTSERVPVTIEGFVLWSVSPEGDAPFRAFRMLGLVNLEFAPPGHTSTKHLLSTPQHRAFRRLLEAAVQRKASLMALDDLLSDQSALLERLRAELGPTEHRMGIQMDDVEIVRIRPSDEELLRGMAERTEAAVREEAATARLEVDERTKKRELAQRAELTRREEEIIRESELAAEARKHAVTRARLERLELERRAHFDDIRREAEAKRDAMDALTSAEEKKSQAVRDHELAQLVAERMATALQQLPLKEARWVTVGDDSPTATIAKLLTSARTLVAQTKTSETSA